MSENRPETPVQRVVRAFGSQEKVGAVCGVWQGAVSQWKNGIIPSRHHRALLEAAKAAGLQLTAEDLIESAPAAAE